MQKHLITLTLLLTLLLAIPLLHAVDPPNSNNPTIEDLAEAGTPLRISLPNASFEDGSDAPDNWTTLARYVVDHYLWETAVVFTGERSISTRYTEYRYGRWLSDPIDVQKAGFSWYTLTGKVKTKRNNGEVYLLIAWLDREGHLIKTTDSPMFPFGDNDWETVTVNGLPPDGTVSVSIWCISNDNRGQTWFDDLKLTVTQFPAVGKASYDQFLLEYPNHPLAIAAHLMRVQDLMSQAKWISERGRRNTAKRKRASQLYAEAASIARNDSVLKQATEAAGKDFAVEKARFEALIDKALWEAAINAEAGNDIDKARIYLLTIITRDNDADLKARAEDWIITKGWYKDWWVPTFLANSAAEVNNETAGSNYTFESIDVPGVEFLELTTSSDFEDYAGNTRSLDGEKMVGFTLIDGVFTTYDFPGSQNTYFYALGNDGRAAGHYEDSDGLYHGVILEDGELRQFDFPGAVHTEIYGISDATGALTGNYIDASGIRRGFTGDEIIELPGASETFSNFVSGGRLVGSYVDAEGIYHAYVRDSDGGYGFVDLRNATNVEYIFFHGINSARILARFKRFGDVPRTHVGTFRGRKELQFPGSVSTQGWNINQDGSVVGYYDSADGRRHGFIARPTAEILAKFRDIAYPPPPEFNYTYESIDVLDVDFLALTASSDFGGYVGYTRSPDGEKTVGFTLIDGVFTTYDFPGSKNTYFYALGNNGGAAGHYEDSKGLYHGVILEDGELRQYDFPGAVHTEIWGISDATEAMTGNWIDSSGVRRGFTGDRILEYPGASKTYADFVAAGRLVGSYVNDAGIYHAYLGMESGFTSIDFAGAENLEYFFFHGINDAGISVGRAKAVGDVPRTYVGTLREWFELQFPGSVSTEGYNINQDGSIVGHYDSADGRRHGFIARPTTEAVSDYFGNVFNVTLDKGLNTISVPLAPPKPMTAKTLAALTGATTVITLDAEKQEVVGWTPSAPDDGFPIEGGKGYIVNVPETREFAFVGSQWTNQMEDAAAAPAISVETSQGQEAWALVVSGHLDGKPAFDGYQVIVRNLRTNSTITASVQGDYFAAAAADLTRRSVVQLGDVIEVRVIGPDRNVESHTLSYKVTPEDLANAVLSVRLDSIGRPKRNLLLQNFPNPFNPETWIPYQLSEDSLVSVPIYDTTGKLIRTLSLGYQSAGFYYSRGRAAYWDGRNAFGEHVASGIYFYQLTTPSFHQTRRLVILK